MSEKCLDIKAATTEGLLEELDLLEGLDSMIDRQIKRLLMTRGVKSMSARPPEQSNQPRLKKAS